MKKIVLASNNFKKIKEIKEILNESNYQIYSLKDMNIDIDIEEDGLTFEENAKKKAIEIYKYLSSNNKGEFIVISDDSGLEVDCLNGAPGVYSARYAGEDATDADRCNKILSELDGVDISMRSARFACALYCIMDDETEYSVLGTMNGFIGTEPMGDNGFGYDPIFYYPPLGKTTAELTPEEKNEVSHRANALKLFYEKMKEAGYADK